MQAHGEARLRVLPRQGTSTAQQDGPLFVNSINGDIRVSIAGKSGPGEVLRGHSRRFYAVKDLITNRQSVHERERLAGSQLKQNVWLMSEGVQG